MLPVILLGQTVNARKEAATMYRRAQGLLYVISNATDSVSYYNNVMEVIDYSLRSDEYDRTPDSKGVVKLRHEDGNRKVIMSFRPVLIDAGLYLTTHRYRRDGINAWKLYIKASESPLLVNDTAEDETGLAAFYIAQSELEARNYKAADSYADIAIKDDEVAQYAAEIKAQCMHDQMVNRNDSIKYLAVLAALYRSDPSNPTYFAWLMRFYGGGNRYFNLENFIDTELQNNPDSPIPWILKGETAMRAKRWDEAIEAYQQADGIDPKRIPVIYNIGICLMNEAIEEEVSPSEAKEATADDRPVPSNLYAQARNYLERVRSMDPRREKVDWVTPLHQIYVVLGDKIKADELSPLVRK